MYTKARELAVEYAKFKGKGTQVYKLQYMLIFKPTLEPFLFSFKIIILFPASNSGHSVDK